MCRENSEHCVTTVYLTGLCVLDGTDDGGRDITLLVLLLVLVLALACSGGTWTDSGGRWHQMHAQRVVFKVQGNLSYTVEDTTERLRTTTTTTTTRGHYHHH